MLYGILDLSFIGYLIAVILLTQLSIACVTIYLHRNQTHQALTLHPVLSHFFRFWLWLTTGICTQEWVAIHRKHHAKSDTRADPHSPQVLGLSTMLLKGAEVYRAAKLKETIERYGHGTPNDWIERNLYTPHHRLGISLALIINLILFGIPGISIWAIQMMWIPFFAAGVINGIGHYYGYRNFEPNDYSTNIIPIGIFIGGEELHNNHHAFPSSAKFSVKWWEFDIGWLFIRLMQFFKLAKVNRVAPRLDKQYTKSQLDLESLKLIISNRLHIMADYTHHVILPVLAEEINKIPKGRSIFALANLLKRPENILDEKMQKNKSILLLNHPTLCRIYQFKVTLQDIWSKKNVNNIDLLVNLKKWCQEAEQEGIPFLKSFALSLPHYCLKN